ncbi:hypothetical protein D0B32_02925 [Paraburkholderia sp. DHOC27]|nr:hypothetical protein D0B32_02925 [Paraburkholderia sp. DHOC27]
MWVRAVGVAVSLMMAWAGTAQAAQYTEVWNPPEARHAPKRGKVKVPAGKAAPQGKNGRPGAKMAAHASGADKPASKAVIAQKSHRVTTAQVETRHAAKPSATLGSSKTRVKTAGLSAGDRKIKTAQAKPAPKTTAAHANAPKLATNAAPTSRPPATGSAAASHSTIQPATQAAAPATSGTVKPLAENSNLPPILH